MKPLRCAQPHAQRPRPRRAASVQSHGRSSGRLGLAGLLLAVFAAGPLLTGCSGSSNGSSVTSTAQVTTGALQVTARTTKGSSNTLSRTTASADGVTVTVDSADISADGTTYQPLVSGPISATLGLATNPLLGAQTTLPTGNYEALRLTISDVAWFADWVTTNRSPCTAAPSGHAQGDQTLGGGLTLYFATPSLGGNTQAYYRAHPPLSGYIGDAAHPLIMPAPVAVLKDKTTTVALVFDTDHILSCNRVGLFLASDQGDSPPQHSIVGEATALYSTYGLLLDPRRGLIGATNSENDSVNLYGTGASGDTAPARNIAGPKTLLNSPRGAVFYMGANTGGNDDEIIVANSGNDSLTTYASTATGNVPPKRTITGFNHSILNQPTGLAVYPLPATPQLDEVWVTNMGNDTVTVYNRINSGDAVPIYPLQQPTPPLPSIGGTVTGLDKPCGIQVAPSGNKVYVFVANSGNDSITVYNRADVAQSSDGKVAPAYTITGPDTGLSSPCGISVDTANNELFVANAGTFATNYAQSSITVYDLTAVPQGGGTVDAVPVRTLSGGTQSGLTAPTAILVKSGSLWVAGRGSQAAMTHVPAVYPSPANGQPASASLKGKYNVIVYGVDFSDGINGQGYDIPMLFAERGIANFDPTASPWPGFNLRIDTEDRRTVIDPGCTEKDITSLPKEGFYGVGNDGSFYAFNEGDHGSLRGAFLPDGSAFAASFYNGPDKLFAVYGIKSTALSTPYLGTDGTQTGATAPYGYASYSNSILGIHRFDPTPSSDLFLYQSAIGAAVANHNQFDGIGANGNDNSLINPMGDFGPPKSSGTRTRSPAINIASASYTAAAGGHFENTSARYGLAGSIAGGGSAAMFIDNISSLDADSCPTTVGMGVALRQATSRTFTNADLKGAYFVSAFGDQFQSGSEPDEYITEAGTLAFDGKDQATMSFSMSNQGQILVDQGTLTYQVTKRVMPGLQNSSVNATINVVDLFGSDKTIPFASALIGEDGKMLAFYRNLLQPNSGPPASANPVRLVGLALYQHP